MEARSHPWPGVQPQSLKRTTVGWWMVGRSRRFRTCTVLSLATSPTLRQQQSAAAVDVEVRGRHVRHHAAGGAWKVVWGVATKFCHQVTGEP